MAKTGYQISKPANYILHFMFILYSIVCIAPLLLVIIVSLTNEKTIYFNGYSYFPRKLSTDAYKFVFFHTDQVLRAYGITIFVTISGSIMSLFVTSMLAYPLSRRDFRYRNAFTFYVFFTLLFSGGFVPWYIICVHFLHLRDTIWALILPYIVNSWYVIIMKTFYSTTIPESILESARIDGASELRTFFAIVTPLAVPGLAAIGLFTILGYWNDWWLPLTLITNEKLINLQYLMYKVELNAQYLRQMLPKMGMIGAKELMETPSETARMAMCIVSIGPIILAYPFLQKYFVKGLTIGAIKG
jgi:putative aldouronate transport system permease protein